MSTIESMYPGPEPERTSSTYDALDASDVAHSYFGEGIGVETSFDQDRGVVTATITNGKYAGRECDVLRSFDGQSYYLRTSDRH